MGSGGLAASIDGGEWSISCPSCSVTRETALGTHSIVRWMVPRADLDIVVKIKNLLCLCQVSHPSQPAHSSHYTYWAY